MFAATRYVETSPEKFENRCMAMYSDVVMIFDFAIYHYFTKSSFIRMILAGPFLPCQDLFDWWTLRCGVWIVFLLAMLGNGTVVFVLIFSRSKMDVPRFLVCNLAAADLFMGVYLGDLFERTIERSEHGRANSSRACRLPLRPVLSLSLSLSPPLPLSSFHKLQSYL